jgi:hypothetical protein
MSDILRQGGKIFAFDVKNFSKLAPKYDNIDSSTE